MTPEAETAEVRRPIGISMSGGGYRAAAFHLGSLTYLYDAGLGDQVEQISTVSGGTFTGARYALSMVEGQSFDHYFRDYYEFLRVTDLVQLALEKLGGPPPDTPSGRHDLIVAMASVYAQKLMRGKDGEVYRFGQILNADIQLKEVVFNATEFRNGVAFRFQKSQDPRALIGNFKLHIRRADAAEIRMADIVAASSCFPAGFEPLSFPYDFTWPGGQIPPDLLKQFTSGGKPFPVAMMDGGIYDNQGVQSLVYADERDPAKLGMFIISDVDQKSPDLYPYPDHGPTQGGPTLGRLRLYGLGLMWLSAASVVAVLVDAVRKANAERLGWMDLLVYAIPLLLSASVAYGLWKTFRVLKDEVLPGIPQVGRAAWRDLKKLGLHQIVAMMHLRVTSVIALTSSVFMKRIRGLVYRTVYDDKQYDRSRIANLVYHLASGSEWPEELPAEVPQPSPALRRVTDTGANMPTTLWFDTEEELRALVASGQATMCFNLMKWMARNHGPDPGSYPAEVRELWERVLEDWKGFVEKPYGLLERRLKGRVEA